MKMSHIINLRPYEDEQAHVQIKIQYIPKYIWIDEVGFSKYMYKHRKSEYNLQETKAGTGTMQAQNKTMCMVMSWSNANAQDYKH